MEGCDRCSNTWGCSRCSSGYYLDTLTSSTGMCSQTCPSGSIPNPVTRTCIASAASAVSSCGTNCLLCVASTTCSQCQSPYLLENGVCKSSCSSTNPIAFNKTCISTCPPGYVNIQAATDTCVPCDPSCLKCSNSAANGCLTCKSGSFLHNGMCLPCNSSCETCSMDTNHCTSCPHGTYLLGSTCVLVCPDISISTITTSEGYSCNSKGASRLLDEQQSTLRILNSNRRTLASASTNQLDLLVYGDPTSETIDSTTTQIIEKLSSKSFMDSFVYSSSSTTTVSSKGTVKISEVSIGQSIIPEAPKLVTETVSYEVKGNIMFFPNITFSGVDGYAYICLVPNNSQTSDISPSSALILSTVKSTSQSTDDYIIEKIRFFNGEALAVLIEEINPNTTYNIVIFGTNEDQSNFAFRTPRVLIQAILGTSLPEGSVGFSSFIFIATEIGAVVFLIVTWLGLFSKIKIKFHKCRRCLRPKPSHVKVRKIQVIRNKDGPTNPQFDLKNASTIIELQADESLRQLGSTQAKSLNPSLVCLEKLGERAEKVNPDDINPLSLSQIPLAEGQSLSNIYVHKVDITLLEVPDEVQDFKEIRFDKINQSKKF